MITRLTTLYERLGFCVRTEGGDFALVGFAASSEEVDMVVYGEECLAAMPLNRAMQVADAVERIGARYGCFQYKIVSSAGFDFDTSLFEARNIAFCAQEYLDALANENHIELFAHNENAYRQICAAFVHSRRVAAIQATGTGKSLIIAKLLMDNPLARILIVAPSNYILNEIGKYLPCDNPRHERMTYMRLSLMSEQEINQLHPEYIVLDEFHRCGATEWGKGVEELMASAAEAKILGTSATPIRYLDGARNMADELFEGNVVVNLSLAKAIVRHILPTPKYVSALYNFESNYNALRSKINRNSKLNKKEHLAQLNAIKRRWEQSAGVPAILSKYMPSDSSKVLVFCKDIEHLAQMSNTVKGWFTEAGYDQLNLFTVHSELDHAPIFRAFEQMHEGLSVLLCVDMLNEGIHVKGVDAVMMLRDTSSPVIYYQQIGRCLTVNRKSSPVIFDLVNNFSNVKVTDFLKEYTYEYDRHFALGEGTGASEERFYVVDAVKDIFELYNSLSNSIELWDERYAEVLAFYHRHGHCRIPHKDNSLWQWLRSQRERRRVGLLTEVQRTKLEAVGFCWNPLDEQWEKMFDLYADYVRTHNEVCVRKSEKALWAWAAGQRAKAKKGLVAPERMARLTALGFLWSVLDERWMAQFSRLKELLLAGKPLVEEPTVYHWAHIQKRKRHRGKLSEWQNVLMDSIAIEAIDAKQRKWNAMYAEMLAYYQAHNSSIIPNNHPNHKLLVWARNQRTAYHEGKLNDEQLERLKAVEFVWNHNETMWDERFKQLKRAIQTNTPPDKSLRMWCTTQRRNKRLLKLSTEQIKKLNSIGVV